MEAKRIPAGSRLESVVITERLKERAIRATDHEWEAAAMRRIAQAVTAAPESLLKLLAAIATEQCPGGSGGISLIESDGKEECFRWVALDGALRNYRGGKAPRQVSPCAVTLERGAPQLFLRPGRYFPDFAGVEPAIIEGLVVPFTAGAVPLGTIWVVSHSPDRCFDLEDVRVMTNLAAFAASAYQFRLVARQLAKIERATRTAAARLGRIASAYPEEGSLAGRHFTGAARLLAAHAERLHDLAERAPRD